MNLNVGDWKEFKVGKIFDVSTTKMSVKDDLGEGNIPFISRTAMNNGCDGYVEVDADKISKGNCLTIGAEGIYCFYQPRDFATGNKVYTLRNKNMTPLCYLFIATILNKEDYKYSYGRARIKSKLEEEIIKLPIKYNSDGSILIDESYRYSEKGYIPDWKFMEEYIKSLNHKPLSTTNRGGCASHTIGVENWKPFRLNELFDVKYGINMELNSCVETDLDDPEGINFVARTESNNGISARVKKVEGKTPQPAGIITCAGGGSVLSTFLQEEPFYSGRDLYLLIPLQPMSKLAKLFCITVIKANKYRYSYGRQANLTLPYLELMLPATDDSKPDFSFMEHYMRSLPYGDRIS